jgi:Uma2 family endonuclease
MTVPASPLRIGAAEYLERERAARIKHELWDGEVFAMAGASLAHNLIVGNLVTTLNQLLRDRPCLVLPSDMKVHVPHTDGYVYPDLTVVCSEPEFVGDANDVIANPGLVAEVLSDSTERFDRGDKFAGYRSLPSVTDYLLVAQGHARIEHYERQADGSWLLREFGPGARLRLRSVDGELGVDDVYRKVLRQTERPGVGE